MTKKDATFLLIFLFLITSSIVTAQENIIKWSKTVELSWDDFKEKKGLEFAYSAVAIRLKPLESTENRITVEVFAYFDRNKSRTGIYDANVLKHEQLHFSIGELFARKLRKKIIGYDKSKLFQDRTEFNRIYRRNYNQYIKYQQRYDKETFNSVNRSVQKRWVQKVRDELKEYEKYTEEIIDIQR